MLRVVIAESKLCKDKVNPESSARGCFQILESTWDAYDCFGDPMDDYDNIECAKKIFADAGTDPWNPSKENWKE